MPQATAKRDVPVRLQDFSKGYSGDPTQAELEVADNVEMGRDGWMKCRRGYVAVGAQITGAPAILGLFDYLKVGQDRRSMLLHSGNLRQYNSTTAVWDLKSAFGGTQTALFKMTSYQDEFAYANRVNTFTPRRYDGTTDQAISGAPAGVAHMLVAHNTLFMAVDSRLWFTDAATWNIPSTNWIDVAPNNAEIISGLTLSGGNVVIWKRGAQYMLFGRDPSSFVLQPVTTQFGNEADEPPVDMQNAVVVLHRRAPWIWTGGQLARIGREVFGSGSLQVGLSDLVGIYDGEMLMLWQATQAKIYVYSELYKHWRRYSIAHTVSCFGFFRTLNPPVYIGTTDGKVFQFGTGTTDDSTAIAAAVQPEDQDLGQEDLIKEVREVFVEGKGTSVSVDLITTYGNGSAVTTSLGTNLTLPVRRACPPNYNTKFSVKVSGKHDLELIAIVAYVRAHRLRQQWG